MLREKAPYPDVYDMLGFIYHQEGRLPEAEEMFREALRLNPTYTEAALNLVVTCNDLGKYAEAKTIYERAMAVSQRAPRELDPFVKGKLANMHAEMGATYRALALYDESLREYERALALCPTFVDLRTELGKTRREMGDLAGRHPRARAGARRAAALRERAHPPRPQLLRGRTARRRGGPVAGGDGGRARQQLGADVPRDAGGKFARRGRAGLARRGDLAGSAAVLTFTPSPETFIVEEIPAYPPSGEGTHTFLWIEKRGLTTFDAIARIARALGVAPRDVGYAGLKDRHALTRQQLSVPGLDPARALEIAGADLTVKTALPHPHKLRLGHLRGNRFEVTVTGEATEEERAQLQARFVALAATGVPNRFGAQRFGAAGDNAAVGLALLRGERRERDKRRRRLLLSALQSAVFNRALELRAASGALAEVRAGDVLQKVESGGLFVTTDPALDQARVDRGELCPTGPLPGGREIRAAARDAGARHRRPSDRRRRRHARGLRRAPAASCRGRAARCCSSRARRRSRWGPPPTVPSGCSSRSPPAPTPRWSSTRFCRRL